MQNVEEVYVKYSKSVYKYIFCLTGNKEIAEDIVQETFLVAVKNINKFEGKCKITTWLCQIAKNIWYSRLKKDNKEISLEDIKDTLFINETIEDTICKKEEKIELLKKIQRLDEETRNVMYLRLFGNLDYNEISEIMNKTPNWAWVVFFRGKKKIKEESKNEKRM